MKSILMSIKPELVEKIINGEKTIEVRKTRPKIDTPFKVYIYCTKGKNISIPESNYRDKYNVFKGFNKDSTPYKVTTGDDSFMLYPLNSKVVAEFICNEYVDFGKHIYLWHISDLKVYDEPKELREFRRPCIKNKKGCYDCKYFVNNFVDYDCKRFYIKAPRSWFYVEELCNEN